MPTLPPSLPADMTLWNEAEMRVMRGPAAAFADTVAGNPDGPGAAATIGHIGRYALKHRLGEGGIGTVYAAHDPLLSRLIAVKTLHVEVLESERKSFNALFLDEARAAARLNHPHIVTVFDAGISDDRAYIAMELLNGRDLRQLRQEGWRAAPAQAALIVRRVADALGYAHSKRVVHRDVKPANIFMVGRTQPKVLDFGIARAAHQHDPQGPGGDFAAGSPHYMAPEQVRQQVVDRRADVFSLGVVLYELLTDVKPFRGATLDEITTAVLTHEPPLASEVAPKVPAALAAITAKAMAKDPEHRYRSARAFSRDLRAWLDENPVAPEADAPAPGAGKRAPLWLAAAALGVVAVGAVASIAWSVLAALVASDPGTERATAPSAAVAPAAMQPAAPAAPAAPPLPTPPTPLAAAAPAGIDSSPSPQQAAAEPPQAIADALPIAAEPAPATLSKTLASRQLAVPAMPSAATSREPRETARDRRAREARERAPRAAPAAPATAPAAATGVVRIAVSPWGEIEVDGRPAGASPPLTELNLPAGRHQIVIRNADLPPLNVAVNVSADQPVSVKHKF